MPWTGTLHLLGRVQREWMEEMTERAYQRTVRIRAAIARELELPPGEKLVWMKLQLLPVYRILEDEPPTYRICRSSRAHKLARVSVEWRRYHRKHPSPRCAGCGTWKSQSPKHWVHTHHDDPKKCYDYEYYCKPCHLDVHREIEEKLNAKAKNKIRRRQTDESGGSGSSSAAKAISPTSTKGVAKRRRRPRSD